MADHEPIIWNDDLVTGVAVIDEQHRILVNTLNEVNVKFTENADPSFLEHITQDLLSYALYHFETEEELLHEYGHDSTAEASPHIEQHRDFSAKVVAVREGLKAKQPISRNELLSFLNNWLINHILKTDKKLAAFLLASDKYRQDHSSAD